MSDELSGDLSGNCRGDCRGSVGEFRCTSWQPSRKCGRAGSFEAPPRGGGGVFHCSLGLLRHHFGEQAGGGIQLQPRSSEALLKGGGRREGCPPQPGSSEAPPQGGKRSSRHCLGEEGREFVHYSQVFRGSGLGGRRIFSLEPGVSEALPRGGGGGGFHYNQVLLLPITTILLPLPQLLYHLSQSEGGCAPPERLYGAGQGPNI